MDIDSNKIEETMIKKKGCIAVFAKTPGLSPLKTRLAKEIGQKKAEDVYVSCVDAVEKTLGSFCDKNPEWDAVWALGEEQGHLHDFWLSRPFEKMWTGEGGLGHRLNRVDETLKNKYEHVILIGTDCPHIPLSFFDQAVRYLQEGQMVVGPSTDGGYYLFGSSISISSKIWESVPYSQDNTLEIFMSLLDNYKPLKIIEKLTDLDVKDDAGLILEELDNFHKNVYLDYIEKIRSVISD